MGILLVEFWQLSMLCKIPNLAIVHIMLTNVSAPKSHLSQRVLVCKGSYLEQTASVCIDCLPSLGRLNCWCRQEVTSFIKGAKDNPWPALPVVHMSFIKGDRELKNVPVLAVLASGTG